jgi:amidase
LTHEKIFKILLSTTLALILVILGVGYVFYYKYLDQVTLQHDNEQISKYKRSLDYSSFGIDDFSNRYQELEPALAYANIEAIQSGISAGDYSCQEVVQFYVYRIKQHEAYNAVLELNDAAMDHASRIDKKIKNNEANSLFCTVVLIKGNIAHANMHTAAGAYVIKDLTTERDAFIVARLEEQDAIILGKANLSEWSNFMAKFPRNGFSVLGGQTKHSFGPYDVGGSSSGPAVAASLGLSTISVGTETSGSLIYPAAQNSTVALKPTLGLVSRDLIIPITEKQDTAGVMARTVADLAKTFPVLVGFDAKDPLTAVANQFDASDLDNIQTYDLAGKRFGYVADDSFELRRILDDLRVAGAIPVEIELPSSDQVDMIPVLLHGIKHDLNAFLNNKDVNAPVQSLVEIVAFNKENEDYMPFGQHYLELGLDDNMTTAESGQYKN